jgi:hypothetical protein
MKRLWVALYILINSGGLAVAATHLEMEACRYTPEVKKELKLTPLQEPRVDKVYADLAPMLQKIQEAMQEREQMGKNQAGQEEIAKQTQKIVALENQCRERGHELLQPILDDGQYKLILEMEEVHRQKVRERRESGQAAHTP